MSKIWSRKFILTILISGFTSLAPIIYKHFGVSDTVSLAALSILGGVAVGYGLINVKDAKNKMLAGATADSSEDAEASDVPQAKAS